MSHDQNEKGIHIGQLSIRVPGKNAEYGERLAQAVGQRLADHSSIGQQGRIGALQIRIQPPINATEADMSHAIGDAIANALRKNRHA